MTSVKEPVKENKPYYDGYLRQLVTVLVQRYENNFDNLLIVTGKEGSGKSHLAMNLCKLYATERGIPFSVDNITFSSEEFLRKAVSSKGGIILYDEAVQGLMGQQWQDKTQQLIIQALMMARKNRNLYVLCIPSVAYLTKYIVAERCLAMLMTYTKQMKRGYANIFPSRQTNMIYILKKANRPYEHIRPPRRIRFLAADKIIDMDKYEKKKDKSIMLLVDKMTKHKRSVIEKKYFSLLNYYDTKAARLMDVIGVGKSQAYKDIKDAKDYFEQVSKKHAPELPTESL